MNDNMQTKEILQRLTLVRATSLGWIQPEYADSLDQLVHEAQRWLDKWYTHYDELHYERDYDDTPLTSDTLMDNYARDVGMSRRWEG